MAQVTNRTQLGEYIFRALGYPLHEVDVTPDQLDDRIDQAIAFFNEHYFDGIVRMYLKHQVTQTDIDNKYITIPDHVWGVTAIFPFSNTASTQPNIFDLQYQLRQWDLRDLSSTSLVYYNQVMSHLALIDNILTKQTQFRFNRLTDKLYLDMDWTTRVQVDSWLLIDCYSALDPNESPKFWNNRMFKEYCIALTKQQWGQNLSKYQNITLPGGITYDGQGMKEEGLQEMKDIEEEIINNSAPLDWFVG